MYALVGFVGLMHVSVDELLELDAEKSTEDRQREEFLEAVWDAHQRIFKAEER